MRDRRPKENPMMGTLQMLQGLMGLDQLDQQSQREQMQFPVQMDILKADLQNKIANSKPDIGRQKYYEQETIGKKLENLKNLPQATYNPALMQALMEHYPYLQQQQAVDPRKLVESRYGDDPASLSALQKAQQLAAQQ